jgi:GTP pyrophosphokinase
MVTVREQLPERLIELSEETTVEHAEQAQRDLAAWLDRVRDILDGAELTNLKRLLILFYKRVRPKYASSSNTFSTGIGMADILAHLHVDEDTLCAAMLYRSVRENVITLEEIQKIWRAGL